MAKDHAIPESLSEEALKRNKKVNMKTVAAHQKLEKELQKLGVEIRPSYSLEPPLGRIGTELHSRLRFLGQRSD